DSRLDLALEILQECENLGETEDQETLGLAGAIFKRKWEGVPLGGVNARPVAEYVAPPTH
ncbi:MAG: hypothetical protein ACYS4W_04320, partial [Planctomycetota bacterium]